MGRILLSAVAIFFAFVFFLGYEWFYPYHDTSVKKIELLVPGATLLIAAVVPLQFITKDPLRIYFIVLFVVNVIISIWWFLFDSFLVNGPDYGAIILRLICLFVLYALIRPCFQSPRKS